MIPYFEQTRQLFRASESARHGLALSTVVVSAVVASALLAGPADAMALSSPPTGLHDARVHEVVPVISAATLPTAVVGVEYVQSISASGDGVLQFTTADPLPPGLTLFATGVLAGTPTATGASSFTFTVTVASAGGLASAKITVPVRSAVGPSISPATLPAVTVGTFYSQKVTASGDGVLKFEALDPLPPGLSIATDGRIFGTPTLTTESLFDVRVRVTSVNGFGAATASIQIPIANPSSVPAITSVDAAAGVVTKPYVFQLVATGVPTPTFAVSRGALPAGLRIDTASGLITGTPTDVGSTDFSVIATNAAGSSAETRLTIVITALPVTPTGPPVGAGGGATVPTGGTTASTGGGTPGAGTSKLAETGAGHASRVAETITSLGLFCAGVTGLVLLRRRRRSGV
ncbi:hypothetical protein B7R22_15660 [Subtercola boreus]|uniref:Gram-positive cocci surface proteins LPxTG domain-containing protein n=1 Tax=Subtercola boreus TaxID=120213 RepID=A0A3E0VSI9_9MICO|nr:Ig domain-containing protein [Subtercola boreus]RFA12550.1 hypothetical protein B7R22_15660 [Subtercola boreus]